MQDRWSGGKAGQYKKKEKKKKPYINKHGWKGEPESTVKATI